MSTNSRVAKVSKRGRPRRAGTALGLAGLVAVVGCRGPTGEVERRVQGRLEDAGIVSVKVSESRGAVLLRGQVDSARDRQHVEELARATPGVVRIEDEVVVRQPAELTGATPESRAAAAAESWLAAEGFGSMHVEAVDGGVRVSGTVSAREHDRAIHVVAASVPPTIAVHDETVVR